MGVWWDSRGLYASLFIILVSFKGISEGLFMRVRTQSSSDKHEDTISSFYLLEGQSFEAECWPDEFDWPEEGVKNYSIQFLKSGIPYMASLSWTEDPLSMSDSQLISGNEKVVPAVKDLVGDRYRVIKKEHTLEDGLKVPKYVLSVQNAKPEDTGKLECNLLEEVNDPHHDPNDVMKQIISEWGPAVKVLGDIRTMEMFTYENNNGYNYNILPKKSFTSGETMQLKDGDIPPVACRLFYPSFYPTVKFYIKERTGQVIQDVTHLFQRHMRYKDEILHREGPIVKMEFMQDYYNDYKDFASMQHFKVNASHDGKQLWCEARVQVPESGLSLGANVPEGDQSLKVHAQYITLHVAGQQNVEYNPQEGEPPVHIPREEDDHDADSKPAEDDKSEEEGPVQGDSTDGSKSVETPDYQQPSDKSKNTDRDTVKASPSNSGSCVRSHLGMAFVFWVLAYSGTRLL